MGYYDRPTPVQDIVTSAFMGAVLGFTFYTIFAVAGVGNEVVRAVGLSEIKGRFSTVHSLVFGAVLGAVLDLVGKLTRPRGRRPPY